MLLEFVADIVPDKKALYAELLTFDMYLRENMKSRPVFALDWERQDGMKEKIRSFYREEAANPHYLQDYEGYQPQQLMKMTHLECFHYPVWREDGVMQRLDQPVFLLFDYKRRDALNYDAATYCIHAL